MANGSAITHVADVSEKSLVNRREIVTPWPSQHGNDKMMVLYQLSNFRELPHPIKYHHADPTSIQAPRYTTRLGLERAQLLSEIALETELEWRLYDMLTAANVSVRIEAMPPKQINPTNRIGRARFRIGDHLKLVKRPIVADTLHPNPSDGHCGSRVDFTFRRLLKISIVAFRKLK